MLRGITFVLIALVASAASLMAAAASTANVYPESFYPQDSGLSFAFHATPRDDDVRVAFGVPYPDPISIEDPDGVRYASGDCHPTSPTSAECLDRFGHYQGRLMAGDDKVVLTGWKGGKLYGGGGDDRMDGSDGDEEIYGDRGRDWIYAGVGADAIEGGPGPDTLVGGLNSDRIRADDGKADNRIDCGPGSDDVARIDRKIDPRPWGCERVVRVR
jgi:hypothetical protein